MAKQASGTIGTIAMDGKLEKAEALHALRIAVQHSTEALPKALEKCENNQQREKVMNDRDTLLLAYLTSLQKSLLHTGPLFEKIALDLEKAVKEIKGKAADLKNVTEAINLFVDVVRLAGSLALAFA